MVTNDFSDTKKFEEKSGIARWYKEGKDTAVHIDNKQCKLTKLLSLIFWKMQQSDISSEHVSIHLSNMVN